MLNAVLKDAPDGIAGLENPNIKSDGKTEWLSFAFGDFLHAVQEGSEAFFSDEAKKVLLRRGGCQFQGGNRATRTPLDHEQLALLLNVLRLPSLNIGLLAVENLANPLQRLLSAANDLGEIARRKACLTDFRPFHFDFQPS